MYSVCIHFRRMRVYVCDACHACVYMFGYANLLCETVIYYVNNFKNK